MRLINVIGLGSCQMHHRDRPLRNLEILSVPSIQLCITIDPSERATRLRGKPGRGTSKQCVTVLATECRCAAFGVDDRRGETHQ